MKTYKIILILAIGLLNINCQETTEVDEGQTQEETLNENNTKVSDEEHEELLKNLETGDINLDDIDDEKVSIKLNQLIIRVILTSERNDEEI